MQVVEHPVLACVREAAKFTCQHNDPGCSPLTSQNGRATPSIKNNFFNILKTNQLVLYTLILLVLVRGAQRRVCVDVNPDPDRKRPKGLYGNHFMNASKEAIEIACHKLNPPTTSNIIAMEAPKNGSGDYSLSTITQILTTAYTSFMAAKIESYAAFHEKGQIDSTPDVIIHTGNWGTGAFGGNKTMMALLQVTAAHLAGIHKLVYWVFHDEQPVVDALIVINDSLRIPGDDAGGSISLSRYLQGVQEKRFKWGISNGT